MLIKRELYLNKIRPHYDTDSVKILTGVRTCGKSVILNQIADDLAESGVDESHILKINLSKEQFAKIHTYNKLMKYISSKIKDEEKHYIFLDDIQNIKGFEKTLPLLCENKNCSVFVTGDHAKLMSDNVTGLFGDSYTEFRIMPFSFAESYELVQQKGAKKDPQEFIAEYMKWGGMPLRFSYHSENSYKLYLEKVYRKILSNDVQTERSTFNQDKFVKTADYVLANTGKEFSAKQIADYFSQEDFGHLEKKMIYRNLDKLEKTGLISRVKRFNISGKQAMTYVEKQYAVDPGFKMIHTDPDDLENAYLLENIIYNELVSRGYLVFTGKTYKSEVDFVVMDGKKKCFIQVAYNLKTKDVIDREFGAFSPISDASPKYVLSLDRFDYSRNGICHMNIADFLLGKKELFLT